MVAEIVFVLFSLFIMFLLGNIIHTFFLSAPFVPSKRQTIDSLLSYLKKDSKFADIGSGDGRVVISCARVGARADGFEMNSALYGWSRGMIWILRMRNAHIYRKNFWNVDFSTYDVVFMYGIPPIMLRMENKLRRELKKGAVVVTNKFPFPTWKYHKHTADVFVYKQT